METARGRRVIARVSEVVGLVGGGHPHAGLRAVVEHDLLGQHEAEIVLEEFPVRLDVHRQAIEMIDTPHVAAARRIALRLIFQRRPLAGRRLVPFGVVVEFDDVAVGVLADESFAVAEVAIAPADIEAGAFERGGAPLERLRAAGTERRMSHARGLRGGELERIALVVVPAAQVDAVAFLAALGHAHHVDEELSAFREFGGEDFDMAEMGDVANRFGLHRTVLVRCCHLINSAEPRARTPGPDCWPAWARSRPPSGRLLARARSDRPGRARPSPDSPPLSWRRRRHCSARYARRATPVSYTHL